MSNKDRMKWTTKLVIDAIYWTAQGLTHAQVGKKLGTSGSAVWNAINRFHEKHRPK